MKLLLTGATGFAGGEVLRQALLDPAITRVTVLTRRRLAWRHPKLHPVLMDDFMDYSHVPLHGHDACIWCLGVSQASVEPDEYVRITLDYTLAAAQAMFAANPAMRFCFVSGRSADPHERGRSLFSRIKGRTERLLRERWGQRVVVLRPGYICPTARTGPRRDLARLFTPLGRLMTWMGPDLGVAGDTLAAVLLHTARHGAPQPVLGNREIRHYPLATAGTAPGGVPHG
ncbi:NAD-dependent epimerase/dehydratase family protein [Stenotrophomonas sp. 24(2023)]|uniref:NAD-dependent epimerase/dehydratase family protein n=1 Tax=Stenotrophomonas sp. 24(2023) TaxID=3068324 RepID=UPI0027E074FC|nr:NAD-dependent epimerase/dehydratase family protein [Stenotrophomonas sp. 24(2023)]WMJ69343.1 epimerase [Stenotrophomonas sp. 24(2023)]